LPLCVSVNFIEMFRLFQGLRWYFVLFGWLIACSSSAQAQACTPLLPNPVPSPQFFDPSGEIGSYLFQSTFQGCPATVTADVPWITFITGMTTGPGNDLLWEVASNPDPAPRHGNITLTSGGVVIAVIPVVVNSTACTYSVSTPAAHFSSSGGSGTFTVTPTPSDCHPYVFSSSTWVLANVDHGIYYYGALPNGGPARAATIGFGYSDLPSSPSSGPNSTLAISQDAGDGSLNVGCVMTGAPRLGGSFPAQCYAVGGSYEMSISAGNLPSGINFDGFPPAGTFFGTITTLGPYNFTVTAQDAGTPQQTASTVVSGTVQPAVLSIICSPNSGPSQAEVPYSTTCLPNGGTSPYQWSINSGSLPTGFSIGNTSGGGVIISGTPVASGPYYYVLEVSDSSSPFAMTAGTAFGGLVNPASCTYLISPGGQAFGPAGGMGSISISTGSGCVWDLTGSISWASTNGVVAGVGGGSVTYYVGNNTGPFRSNVFTIAGLPFTIEQQAASIPGLGFIGSMPHIAAEENWTTSFTLVNKGASSATARLSLFGDPGGTLTLPLLFPQITPEPLAELAASLDRTISSNASLIITSGGPQVPPVQVGSAQQSATGNVDGFAIFHLIPGSQEAVVPMETRNAGSYILAYDNTGGVVLGVAVANVSSQPGTVGVILRDDTGAQIGTGSLAMQADGHTSFVLSTQYPVTAEKRGTVEFDTPPGGQISVLGIRTTPLGSSNTLTTIPALANVGTSGGSIAHIATGNGWQTTFVLVNTGNSSAQVNLNLFADITGAPLAIPLSLPQTGTGSTASSVSQSLAAGASLYVTSAAPASNPAPTIGSAQLTTNGNVGGFVIFRYNPNGQEAVVPLESRTANGFVIAFDNTAGTATGIAVNSVSAQAVNVPVIVRDDMGNQIATDTLNLAAKGHLAFTLVSDKYAQTANIRGTIEFDTPPGSQIGALGIRIPIAHTFTTLPALAK
jgi:Putative Ig domain